MEEWLIVDGYNIIGAWPELNQLKTSNLPAARDRLIDLLSEYAFYTGQRVVIVFDAYLVPGSRQQQKRSQSCTVVYTEKGETADEYIERLVGELKSPHKRRLFVATSDYTEQRITFGRGALRISARELLIMVNDAQQRISQQVKQLKIQKNTLRHGLGDDIKRQLEQWKWKE